jgi:hypothetical protein
MMIGRFTSRLAVAALATLLTVASHAAAPEVESAVQTGAPEGDAKPMGVFEAKAKAADAEKVTVAGRVKDIIDGQAVFTLIDNEMKSCKDNGENCPTPWDYCCYSKSEITSGTATVKLVGESGGQQALKGSLKGVKGVDHLVNVTVTGTAQKDKRGNLVVLADRVYVKK